MVGRTGMLHASTSPTKLESFSSKLKKSTVTSLMLVVLGAITALTAFLLYLNARTLCACPNGGICSCPAVTPAIIYLIPLGLGIVLVASGIVLALARA